MSPPRSVSSDRDLVSQVLRLAAGWLSATQVGEVSPSFGVDERSMIRSAARVLEAGLRTAAEASPDLGEAATFLDGQDRRIVALLAAGGTYQAIANRLHVTYAMVHTRIKALYRRFGVHSNLALVSLFRDANLGPVPRTLAAHRARRPARAETRAARRR